MKRKYRLAGEKQRRMIPTNRKNERGLDERKRVKNGHRGHLGWEIEKQRREGGVFGAKWAKDDGAWKSRCKKVKTSNTMPLKKKTRRGSEGLEKSNGKNKRRA